MTTNNEGESKITYKYVRDSEGFLMAVVKVIG